MSIKKLTQDIIETNQKQAWGYIRVSDQSQIEGSSLLTQTRAIEKFCTDNNLELLDIKRDEGKSGRSTRGRDGLAVLLSSIQPYNWVILYELSRLSRDQADVINTFRDLVNNKKCTFICLNPEIDSRKETCQLMLGIYSSVAQEESNRISIRVSHNMNMLSSEGNLMTRPPFGYKHNKETRKYIEDTEQQQIVNEIEIMYLSGVNINQISKRLNEERKGHVLNNNKVKHVANPKFTACTVGKILRGYGIIKDNKTPQFLYPQKVENWNSNTHKSKTSKRSNTCEKVPCD
jgi:DNA invertase Pin-like site-specific DNA recombinase